MIPNKTGYLTEESIFADEVDSIVSDRSMINVIIEVSSEGGVIGYFVGTLPPNSAGETYRRNKRMLVRLCTGLGEIRRAFTSGRRKASFRLLSELDQPVQPVYYWKDSSDMIADLKLEIGFRTGGSKWNLLWEVVRSFMWSQKPVIENVTAIAFSCNAYIKYDTPLVTPLASSVVDKDADALKALSPVGHKALFEINRKQSKVARNGVAARYYISIPVTDNNKALMTKVRGILLSEPHLGCTVRELSSTTARLTGCRRYHVTAINFMDILDEASDTFREEHEKFTVADFLADTDFLAIASTVTIFR